MKIDVTKLRIGTLLEGTISISTGEILYKDKILFTKELRQKLLSENITVIEYSPIIKVENKKSDFEKMEEDKIEKLLSGYHKGIFSKESIRQCLHSLRNLTFNFLTRHDSLDFSSCKDSILKVYEDIKHNPYAMMNLLDIKLHDDYTFCHSINVAIISLSLAQKMGYSDEEVQLVGLGGLLHDIGKVAVPASLINKTSVLTEEEKRIMKSHPSHSYRIMKQIPGIDQRIIMMAFEHHERFDGKGYPRGITGDSLHDLSVIVALADVYDALTTVRSYKPAFSPEESIQVIETYTGSHFAPRIAEKFIKDIQTSIQARNYFKKGSLVLLNTGEVAQIIYCSVNMNDPEIVVQILTDPNNKQYKNPKRINLKIDKSIAILREIKNDEINWENLHIKKLPKDTIAER